MKKLKLIALLSLVLITSIIVVGCGNRNDNENDNGNVDYNLEYRIRNDFLFYMHSQGYTDKVIDDVKILQIFGNFDGVVVVRFYRGAFHVITPIQVGGVELIFSDSNIAIVWYGGQFLGIQEAYDDDLLSKENLIVVANKLN